MNNSSSMVNTLRAVVSPGRTLCYQRRETNASGYEAYMMLILKCQMTSLSLLFSKQHQGLSDPMTWWQHLENVKKKKKKRFDKQNKTFSCASHFLYISLPFLHDCSMKMPNFTFYGEHKQAATIFDKVSR